MYYFSKSTNGFYSVGIHGDAIPADAVKITDEYHSELMSSGGAIIADEKGYPIAINYTPQSRTKLSLLADVAARRWQAETGGIVIGGTPIATDRESQAQLSSAYTSLSGGLIADTPWKAADGSFTMVTLAGLEPVAQSVAAHVRACFDAERIHCEAISALSEQADLDAYDITAGWPE